MDLFHRTASRERLEYLEERLATIEEERDASISDSAALSALFGWPTSGLSSNVTQDSALESAAVLACVRVRAETFASLPCHVYKRNGSSREVDSGNPLSDLLSRKPNPYLTPYEFWEWKQTSEDICGNTAAYIERDNRGNPIAFWPMKWSGMSVLYKNRKLMYRYSGDDNNPANDYHSSDILHFKGPITKDGLPFEGKSLVDITNDTIGLGIQTEIFFSKFLNNGSHFPTYFEMDSNMNPKMLEAFRQELRKIEGVGQAGQSRAFPPGVHVKQNEMSIKDMDLTPQLRWNLEQISRIWRVPLPLLNDLTHGTYTNSEQASLWLAQYTISPIVSSTEQVLNKKLARADGYVKFNMSSLLRGDAQTRAEYYNKGINSGWMTRADARGLEDMNPIEGLERPLVSLTMGALDSNGDTVNPNALAPIVDNARSQIRARFERDNVNERSMKYAAMVAGPVIETLNNLGIKTDIDTFIEACKGDTK